jgi:hypothetical protein
MSQITISLEGTSAIALAEALKGLPGFEVSFEVGDPTEAVRGEKLDRVLVTLTAMVTLATNTVELVDKTVDLTDKLMDRIEHVQGCQVPPVESVLIVSDQGKRETLKNATAEQIVEALKEME